MTALTVVLPVHNEAAHLQETIDALVEAVEQSDFDAELVVVDDGSTDDSAAVVRHAIRDRLAVRIISQPNRGRFEARQVGLDAADADWVLLLDGRARLIPSALRFVHEQIATGHGRVWNGHIHVTVDRNPYGAFWNVLAELAWREYFDNPRTTSYDKERFDHYPKGTTCFLAPRQLLLDAIGAFRSYYADSHFVSDDTGPIRWLAERERIYLSPEFAGHYAPRTTATSFLRQALYRGSTFVDGHLRRGSRFYPVAAAFFPASIGLSLAALRRPILVPALAAVSGAAAGIVAARAHRTRFEALSVALCLPPYAVAHGLGMWRGLAMLIGAKRRAHNVPDAARADLRDHEPTPEAARIIC